MAGPAALDPAALKRDARVLEKGNVQAENALFSTLTLHFNPHYFNVEYAKAHGHRDTLLNPLLIFNTVFGLSVEDLSEAGMGPFLGVDEMTHHRPVLVGETLTARSTVTAIRDTRSRPDFGIVTWHTQGFQSDGELVIDFKRSNLIRRGR